MNTFYCSPRLTESESVMTYKELIVLCMEHDSDEHSERRCLLFPLRNLCGEILPLMNLLNFAEKITLNNSTNKP